MKNDFEMMSKYLQSKDLWSTKLELGLKDLIDRNACDISIEMGHQ